MGTHPPGPEDAEQQDNGTGDLASTAHSRRLSRWHAGTNDSHICNDRWPAHSRFQGVTTLATAVRAQGVITRA